MSNLDVRRSARAGAGSRGTLTLCRVAGVDLVLHWSLLVVVGLIAFSLGAGVFPAWHPEWTPAVTWATAVIAAVAFFASVAIHELAHVVVARTQGINAERITLFLFGGMTQTERHPDSPRAELLIAAVGPAVSLIVGVAASVLGVWMTGVPAAATAEALVAAAGPVATVLLWLGPINVVLAAFNMVPGFPLDGGRVLRALLWWVTGSISRATVWAARGGQLFAWVLIGAGILMAFGFVIPVVGGGVIPGLWMVLVGWFLHNAAATTARHTFMREALDHVPVAEVMRSRVATASPDTPVDVLVTRHFLQSDQLAVPLIDDDGALLGVVDIRDARALPRAQWPYLRARDIMTPAVALETTGPEASALEVLQRLSDRDVEALPVVDHGHGALRGIVRGDDIAKWLWVHTAHDGGTHAGGARRRPGGDRP